MAIRRHTFSSTLFKRDKPMSKRRRHPVSSSSHHPEVKQEEKGYSSSRPNNPCVNFVNSASSFFSGALSRAYSAARWGAAMATGIRFLGVSGLRGNPCGKLTFTGKDRGKKLGRVVMAAGAKAIKDKNGLCQFWVGTIPVLVVTQPHHIRQILKENENNIHRRPALQTFAEVYGDNFFIMDTNDSWKEKRKILEGWLFNDKALEELVPIMQAIIDDFMENHLEVSEDKESKPKEIEIEKLFVKLTMEIFGRSRFGTGTLVDVADKISKTLDDTMEELIDPWNSAVLKLSSILKYLRINYQPGRLKQAKKTLHDVYEECVLDKNQTEIRKTKNILMSFAELEQKSESPQTAKLNTETLKGDGTFFWLAGHETTGRFLTFLTVLLGDHPEVLRKVREEIEANKPADGKLDKNSLDKLVYMDCVLNEALRLYPPAGVIARGVTKPFNLRNDKDPTKVDAVMSPGDFIFIVPMVTHKLDSLYRNPTQFIPERFDPKSELYDKVPFGGYIPFGIGSRNCVGQRFAKQEAKMVIMNLATKFNFECNVKHPVPTHMHGTEKPNERVTAHVQRRI